MPDGTQSPRSAELDSALQEAERRRADLTRRVADLRANLTETASLAGTALHAPAIALKAGRSVATVVRKRPATSGIVAGAALAAVGLGIWAARRRSASDAAPVSRLAGTEAEAVSRWADDGGPVTQDAAALVNDGTRSDRASLEMTLASALDTLDEAVRAGLATAEEAARDRAALIAAHGERVAAAARASAVEALGNVASAAGTVAGTSRAVASEARARVVERPLLAVSLMALAGAAVAMYWPTGRADSDTSA